MKNLKKGNCLISWSSTSNTDYFGYDLWEKGSVSHTVNGSIGKDAHYLKINDLHEVQLSKTRKRENAKRENGFRVRVSKKLKFFRVLFLRFRVSKTRNGKRENAKIDFAFRVFSV